jgi:NitT/TauT family transport system permease protein
VKDLRSHVASDNLGLAVPDTSGHQPDPADTTEPKHPPAGGRYGKQLFSAGIVIVIQVLLVVLFMGAWHLAGSIPGVSTLIGSPIGTVEQLGKWLPDPKFWANASGTLLNGLAGLGLGFVLACVLLLITWPFDFARRFSAPFISVLNAVPRIALAPLFIVWFGIGSGSAVAFVVAMIFLLIYINVFTGLSSIDEVYPDNARVLGARGIWLARSVYIPAVAAWLMTSLRMAAIWSILGAAVAEYLAGSRGLGGYLSRGAILGAPDMLIAAAIVIAVFSLIIDRVLQTLETRFSRWRIF